MAVNGFERVLLSYLLEHSVLLLEMAWKSWDTHIHGYSPDIFHNFSFRCGQLFYYHHFNHTYLLLSPRKSQNILQAYLLHSTVWMNESFCHVYLEIYFSNIYNLSD
uniref:Secreted protein n=1 Tax=Heterorhabditis bacteriophora TaxID=37862 RepID=A0A1I7WY26_HETBA